MFNTLGIKLNPSSPHIPCPSPAPYHPHSSFLNKNTSIPNEHLYLKPPNNENTLRQNLHSSS